ncbi:MAG TPA: hypothetical protein VJJ26_03115 [Candidatus Babeliales bacterium]|nr:hypothetical protein [Candidatus Babeliales bacterium]
MLKELKDLSEKLIFLNLTINHSLFSEQERTTLENSVKQLFILNDSLAQLNLKLSEFPNNVPLIDLINADKVITLLITLHQNFSATISYIHIIRMFTEKMICNYEKQWNKLEKQ